MDAASTTRRGGRPRADGRPTNGDPTDEILAAASALLQRYGVDGTTMTKVAAEAGLRQSSLYYYFPNRDALIAALVARANVVPLDLVEHIVASGGTAAARLYRFVQGDVEALCALPFDINEIHRVAARDRTRFEAYWRERSRLERRLASIVDAGVEQGEFRAVQPLATARLIMSNDEGVQNWYRLGTSRRPSAIGTELADMAVGGLLAPGRRIDDVAAEVSKLY